MTKDKLPIVRFLPFQTLLNRKLPWDTKERMKNDFVVHTYGEAISLCLQALFFFYFGLIFAELEYISAALTSRPPNIEYMVSAIIVTLLVSSLFLLAALELIFTHESFDRKEK